MSISPFKSFWMAGYECADHLNKYGDRADLLLATNHIHQLESDYALLSDFHITTVREGIRWSAVEIAPYTYDWAVVSAMIHTGRTMGIQQIWDICHFGYPDDLTPLHPAFSKRFEALCIAFSALYRSIDATSPLMITPINEVSFLSWLGGEVAGTSPFCVRQGWEVKYHLMRAYIKGVAAIKSMDSNVIVISTEPLVHIVNEAGAGYDDLLNAQQQREEQFQSLDMLCGRICPELGGRPDYLDVVGVNFYYSNQWTYGTNETLPWAAHDRHELWCPLSALIKEVHHRYGRPIVITETSHPGEDRGRWLEYIGEECRKIVENNIPLWGICIYPIIDRPDWDDLNIWHHSGLWDMTSEAPEKTERTLNLPLAEALTKVQASLYHAIKMNERSHAIYFYKEMLQQ